MSTELGILAAMVTPYDDDGRVAYKTVERLTDYSLAGGADGVYVCGSTGEFPLLALEERCAVLEAVLSAARGRAGKTVIANVSAQRTDEIRRLALHALEHGADALSLVAPGYYRYDGDAMLGYFQWFAGLAQGAPVYLYNMPSNTGNPIPPGLIARLRRACPNVKGVKDSSMDFMVLMDYMEEGGPGFQVLTGNDAQVLWALEAGGSGAVIAGAGVFPAVAARLYSGWREGRMDEARRAQALLYRYRGICRSIMPGMAQKKTLEFLGFPMGRSRLPFRELSPAEERRLYDGLLQLGLLEPAGRPGEAAT